MATAVARPEPVNIPNKLYFRIGEVTRLAGVEAHVLRYWESEFHMLAPKKSGANQRLYRRKDVEMVLEIKRLLYEKRFTIEGAKANLQERRAQKGQLAAARPAGQSSLFQPPDPAALARIREELRAVLHLLT